MAYDIGPRIGIEGESEFRKAINDIISTQRTLATEMDAVSSAFDKNDQSEEALAARNEVLNKQIETQREKLAALQKGLEAAAEKYGENDRVTQGWQQALNRATADLNNMERQLRGNNSALEGSANSLENLGNSMDNASDKASVFGDVLGADLVAGGLEKVAETAKEAAKSVLEFAMSSDSSVGMLQAQLGLTKDQAADLTAVAAAVWSNGFGDSLEEATESVAIIRQSLGDMAEDEMGSITQSALIIAKIFGADVNDSVKAAKAMIENFEISSQKSFDLIAIGYQNGLNYSGEFLDVLGEYSPQFASLGYTADEAFKLMIAGTKNGAMTLDKVADVAKEFNIRIKDGSTTTQEGLKLLGISYDDLVKKIGNGSMTTGEAMQIVIEKLKGQKDIISQNQAGTDLMGSQWEDLGAKAVLALDDTSVSLANVEGATKRAGDALNDNLRSKFEIALRGIQESIEPLAESILNFANNAMPQVKESLQWVSDHSPAIAAGVAGIAAGFLAWNISSMLATVVTAIVGFKDALLAARMAQEGLNLAMKANIIGIIITVIAAAVVAIMTLWNTNEGFRAAVIGAWNAISSTAQVVWGAITTFFTETIPNAVTSAINWFSQLPANISNFFGQIPGMVSNFFASALSSITQFGANIINWVATQIPLFVSNFITFINELPGKLGYALGFALGTLLKWGLDAVNWVITEVPKIIDNIIKFFTELPGKIATTFTNVITEFGKWGSNVISWISTEVPKFIRGVVNFFSELPGKIMTFLTKVITNLGIWASNMLSMASTEVPKIVSSIVSFFTELPGDIFDIGVNIVEGLWNGVNSMVSWLGTKIKDFAQGILRGMKDALGIRSPSTVMRDEVGLMLGAGMAIGIDDSISNVKAAMARMNQVLVADANISTSINTTKGTGNQSNKSSTSINSEGLIVTIENFINNRPQDVQAFAEELDFYRRQASTARGGS